MNRNRAPLFIFLFFVPLLFTSCLADVLNKQFKLEKPLYIYYNTEYGTQPERLKVKSGTRLTQAELPTLTSSDNTFDGWYLESHYSTKVNAGYTITETTYLYAKWKYQVDRFNEYEVHILLADLDGDDKKSYVYHEEYTKRFKSQQQAADYKINLDGYEYVVSGDRTYHKGYSYDEGYEKDIWTVEKHYYKNHIRAQNLTYAYNLNLLNDKTYTYTLHLSSDLTTTSSNNFSYLNNAPPLILDLQEWINLTEISNNTFYNSSSIRKIILPSGITTIGSDAFDNCKNLNTIYLPASLTEIKSNAFRGCYNLTEINYAGSESQREEMIIEDDTIKNYAWNYNTSYSDSAAR